MPAALASYVAALRDLFADLLPFFAFGFLGAGIVAEFVPREKITRYFGRNDAATLARATLAGMLTSVCSCGAIPLAVTLRRKGATRAAAMTFLLAAPWAGFVPLLVFTRFLGPGRAAVMFAGALGVATVAGFLLARMEDRGWLEDPARGTDVPAPPSGCGKGTDCAGKPGSENGRRLGRAAGALRHAAETFRAMWKFLLVGLLLAAAVKAFVPSAWIARYLGGGGAITPVLLAVPLAAALELCSEGLSVFAGQLYTMGASLAVVFVVTLVGVTTDYTELSVIWGAFGRRSAVAYLLTATAMTLCFAYAIQAVVR